MRTGIDYRISSTLDNLELAYWVQYYRESTGSIGVLYYWVIFQNQLIKINQSEVNKLVRDTHGMHSHSLKLAIHRLLVSKLDHTTQENSIDRNVYW